MACSNGNFGSPRNPGCCGDSNNGGGFRNDQESIIYRTGYNCGFDSGFEAGYNAGFLSYCTQRGVSPTDECNC